MKLKKKSATVILAAAIGFILMTQIVAVTAWTADSANQGPSIVILELSSDADTRWAMNDLRNRLSEFITDDPFFQNRITHVRTSDPRAALEYPGDIIVYISHGGPLGMVTGKRLTSWETMAEVVMKSNALLHLFAACASRNIIRYGDEESGKKLYTVPGARPAEVTNVEITSTIMLALGINSEQVEEYRKRELTKAKELVQSGASVHIMDFEQVVLDEIEYIDDHYSDSYTDTHRVYRFSEEYTLSGIDGFNDLPLELRDTIMHYFRVYVDDYGVPYTRLLHSCSITYVMNYYYEAEWVVDDSEPPPPDDGTEPKPEPDPGDTTLYSTTYFEATSTTSGHWEYGPDVFNGGTYSGLVIFEGDGCVWDLVVVNVTASGPTKDSNDVTIINSISLNQNEPRGLYVQKQKVDGVWQEPTVGRNPSRTGGSWTDPCVKADYEYDANWAIIPGYSQETSGNLYSNGEWIYPTNIPTGTGWHGPSFVRTLPSYFEIDDLGAFSANMSLIHSGINNRMGSTFVNLYDSNKKIAVTLQISDAWAGSKKCFLRAGYYREDGSASRIRTDYVYGDLNGIATVRYDPLVGIFADVPGKSETLLYTHNQINTGRLIKYVVIQSYRYSSYSQHDDRIYSIQLSYAGSEFTVFHDSCNDVDEFVNTPTFPYYTRGDGKLVSPSSTSYMTWDYISTGSGWHGPMYVHTLDRPFRLYQLSEFSVIGQLLQSSSTMGKTHVALFDENMKRVALVYWGDSWVGSTKGYFYAHFSPQNGGSGYQSSGYLYSSFKVTGRFWWDQ